MSTFDIRDELHKQIDQLPDEIVEQIADFALFVMARRKLRPPYFDWQDESWQTFSLEQFFREDDDVEYALEDAQEVFD